jgi:hypothetical protein
VCGDCWVKRSCRCVCEGCFLAHHCDGCLSWVDSIHDFVGDVDGSEDYAQG